MAAITSTSKPMCTDNYNVFKAAINPLNRENTILKRWETSCRFLNRKELFTLRTKYTCLVIPETNQELHQILSEKLQKLTPDEMHKHEKEISGFSALIQSMSKGLAFPIGSPNSENFLNQYRIGGEEGSFKDLQKACAKMLAPDPGKYPGHIEMFEQRINLVYALRSQRDQEITLIFHKSFPAGINFDEMKGKMEAETSAAGTAAAPATNPSTAASTPASNK